MVKILNYKLKKKKYETISVGIGIDDGRALMVKAGYSGSGINDVVWMGDVVNTACHLANKAGRGKRKSVILTKQIYENITNEECLSLLSSYSDDGVTMYEGNLFSKEIDDWYEDNCP